MIGALATDEIVETFRNRDRVELRGLGAFTAKSRTARMGRNPRTGSTVVVDAKRAPSFRPSKEFYRRLIEDPVSTTPQHATERATA